MRPSLEYCLFPILMCNNSRGGQEVIYLLCQCAKASAIKQLFQMHFTNTVTFEIAFKLQVWIACDNHLVWAVTGNKQYSKDGLKCNLIFHAFMLKIIVEMCANYFYFINDHSVSNYKQILLFCWLQCHRIMMRPRLPREDALREM